MPKLAWEVKALCLRLADNAESKPPSLYEQPAQYASDTHSPSSSLPVGRPEDTGRPGRTADVVWRGILSNRRALCSSTVRTAILGAALHVVATHACMHAQTRRAHRGRLCRDHDKTCRGTQSHLHIHCAPHAIQGTARATEACRMGHNIPCDTVSHATRYPMRCSTWLQCRGAARRDSSRPLPHSRSSSASSHSTCAPSAPSAPSEATGPGMDADHAVEKVESPM